MRCIFKEIWKKRKEENERKAKELFIEYDGSMFGMWKDMVLKEFEKYKIPEKVRKKWREELIIKNENIIKTATNNAEVQMSIFSYERVVESNIGKDVIMTLVNLVKERFDDIDTFTVCCGSESVVNLAEEYKRKRDGGDINFFKSVINEMIDLMEKNIARGVIISKDYCVDGKNPRYIEEHELEKRMNEDLSYYKELRDDM